MKGKKKSKGSPEILDEPQKTIKKIGARIKALRIKAGYSSYETFAYEKGIDRAQYGKYERGADMRTSSIIRVLKMLDVTIQEFYSEGFED
jgi:transcriptional regulator with XRE-family HTH domain